MTDLCSGMDLQFACINMLVCFLSLALFHMQNWPPGKKKLQ